MRGDVNARSFFLHSQLLVSVSVLSLAPACSDDGGGTTGASATTMSPVTTPGSSSGGSSSGDDTSGGDATTTTGGTTEAPATTGAPTTTADTSGSATTEAPTPEGPGVFPGESGLEAFCRRYVECGGTYYADQQECIDESYSYWGECPSRKTALDVFGACMADIACGDWNPDAYNPGSTPCAQQWQDLGQSEACG